MDLTHHNMNELFAQLGLPDSEEEIQAFVSKHHPLPVGIRLVDAPFWTEAQARFLKEGIKDDADWAEVVDQLSLMLQP